MSRNTKTEWENETVGYSVHGGQNHTAVFKAGA